MSLSKREILPPIQRINSSRKSKLFNIHKQIIITIGNVEKYILYFGELLMRKYRTSQNDMVKFLEFLEEKLNVGKIERSGLLLNILDHNSNQSQILGGEFYDLKNLGEKLVTIEKILLEVPSIIDSIFNESLTKYCISLIDEIKDNVEVPPITREYEDIIIDTKLKLSQLTEQMGQIDNLKETDWTVRNYLKHHDKINESMLKWSEIILQICKLAKSWVDIDILYPEKLKETIMWLRNQRQYNLTQLHKIRKKQVEIGLERSDLEKSIKQHENAVNCAKFDSKHYGQRDRNVVAAREKIHKSIEMLMGNRDECVYEKSRSTNHDLITHYNEQIQICEMEIKNAKKRLDRLNGISSEFNDAEKKSYQSADRLSNELIKDREDLVRIDADFEKNDQQIMEIIEMTKAIDDQIILVEKLRALKTNDKSLPMENNYSDNNRSYQPNYTKSFNDELDDFFKVSAPVIGKLWKDVYKQLPFDPPRDWKQRELDLEAIDIKNRRLDPDFNTLAYLALQKWRRLSTQSTMINLIKVLRKFNLAQFVLPRRYQGQQHSFKQKIQC